MVAVEAWGDGDVLPEWLRWHGSCLRCSAGWLRERVGVVWVQFGPECVGRAFPRCRTSLVMNVEDGGLAVGLAREKSITKEEGKLAVVERVMKGLMGMRANPIYLRCTGEGERVMKGLMSTTSSSCTKKALNLQASGGEETWPF